MPPRWGLPDFPLVGRDLVAVAHWGAGRRPLVELPSAFSHPTPDRVRFVTDDIPSFWMARSGGPGWAEHYFRQGTPGLREFRHRRPQFAALERQVRCRRRFYDSVREASLALHADQAWRAQTRQHWRLLQSWLPEARFPEVYVVMGGLFTAGTAGLDGLLLSAEFFTRGAGADTPELGSWERAALRTVEELPFVITHELVHALQRRANPNLGRLSLLGRALEEGVADFVAALVTGTPPRTDYFEYGLQHEAQLWREFRAVMRRPDTRAWLYQGPRAVKRPADLGYFVGFRIAQAYFARSGEKSAALRELLDVPDPFTVLRISGYGA
ncbi:DUF2268 domain-containing putative Zn-dependent protease [Deinococcus peraridilitoris]|uniref:Putative Zn-dependent protease (DUF2268) n=1 Tax=Deinococcus peraridilitoris (strain DSM 19664 / LMG 22246 / CIP 109416 / KR-200) TaxID=937777 RepID=L0A134_DEIPD|nr:DUF2268 domain-containing putative Zn-dependent protease [Deinococcus peraridilitoris]AFZ67154.1 putative Zn-dependent protease (DUF2268) [Deinococcus peraridilitoris DSM 19664]